MEQKQILSNADNNAGHFDRFDRTEEKLTATLIQDRSKPTDVPTLKPLPRRFFILSCEADAQIAYVMTEIMETIEHKLSALHADDYGDALLEISVIPICMEGNRPERKFVSHQNKYADMRLRMNYTAFRTANSTTKYVLCADTVIASVSIIGKRIPKKHFDCERLLRDVRHCLYPELT